MGNCYMVCHGVSLKMMSEGLKLAKARSVGQHYTVAYQLSAYNRATLVAEIVLVKQQTSGKIVAEAVVAAGATLVTFMTFKIGRASCRERVYVLV